MKKYEDYNQVEKAWIDIAVLNAVKSWDFKNDLAAAAAKTMLRTLLSTDSAMVTNLMNKTDPFVDWSKYAEQIQSAVADLQKLPPFIGARKGRA